MVFIIVFLLAFTPASLGAARKKKKKKKKDPTEEKVKELAKVLTAYDLEDNKAKCRSLYKKIKKLVNIHGFKIAERAVLAMGRFKKVKSGLIEGTLPRTKTSYVLYIPPDYNPKNEPFGLVVGLHRPGHSGKIMFDKFYSTVAGSEPFFFASPDLNKKKWNSDSGAKIILEMVREVMKHFKIDPGKVFLAGYQNGGDGVWNFVTRHGDVFAGACAMAGFLEKKDLPNVVNTPMLTFYGTLDNEISVALGEKWAKRINDRGGKVEVETVKAQHLEYSPFYGKAERILEFFNTCARKEPPKRVQWKTLKYCDIRCHWVAFLKKGKYYAVDARIIADNRIDIEITKARKIVLYLSARIMDFSKPLEIYVGKKRIFHKKVSPDVDVLIEGACEGKFRVYSARLVLDIPADLVKQP
jgi:predicted esterase